LFGKSEETKFAPPLGADIFIFLTLQQNFSKKKGLVSRIGHYSQGCIKDSAAPSIGRDKENDPGLSPIRSIQHA
jgi:hypothetical protein